MEQKKMDVKIVILGGGAAGFFAAVNAAFIHKNAKVILLEKSNKLLSKVRVSGGGRCNVTHACFDNNVLVKNYPRGEKQLKSAFSRFSVKETIEWFESRGVNLKVEADGRMFPESDNSESIIACLLEEAKKCGVEIKIGTEVTRIEKLDNGFSLYLNNGNSLETDKLIIATGGSPKEESYNWLKRLGHIIVKPVPSLYTFNVPNSEVIKLMGLSVSNVKVKIVATKLEQEGPILITHWGFSGPAVLKLSAWGARELNELNYDFQLVVNWLPNYTQMELKEKLLNTKNESGAKLVINSKPTETPSRLWSYFLAKVQINENTRWADLSNTKLNLLLNCLQQDEYNVKGKTTFKEEFVTCGGINLSEVDFKTMQSKIVPNLFFTGEVLDIDGVTGGFNFQNAWTTAWIAANAVC